MKVVTIACDIPGEEHGGQERADIGLELDGEATEIDLCARHEERLRADLSEFVAFARPVAPASVRPGRPARTVATRRRARDVRQWAREQGMEINDMGRIPENIQRLYDEGRGRKR